MDSLSVGKVIFIMLEVLIAISCCLGNILVVWAVWSCKSLQQPTFFFMVSLAVADFLVGCVGIPFGVMAEGLVETSFHACLFLSCVVILLTQASILSLLAIAVDRFLRVFIPFRYKFIVTKQRSWLVVAASWFFSVILSFLPLFGWHNHDALSHDQFPNSTTMVCVFIDVIPMSYLVYLNFYLCSMVPLLLMAVLYCYIFNTFRKRLRGNPQCSAQSHASLKKERSLAGSLALVLVIFAICWLPLHIMNTVTYYGRPSDIPLLAFYVGMVLSHANSSVNPIIYALKIKKIKQQYLHIWKTYVVCTQEEQQIIHSNNIGLIPSGEPRTDQLSEENSEKT